MPFVPTPAEVALVNQLFLRGDTQKLNALTGDKAVSILKASNLPEATLGDIWVIGDPENNGFLTRAGAAKVVRLIGWAQHGEVNIGDHLLENGMRETPIVLRETPAYALTCSRTTRGARRISPNHGSVCTSTKATLPDIHNCSSATPHISGPPEVPGSIQWLGPCGRLPRWSVYYLLLYLLLIVGSRRESQRTLHSVEAASRAPQCHLVRHCRSVTLLN
jgi:hypothetical protein